MTQPEHRRLLSIKDTVDEIGGTVWFWRTQIWSGEIPYIQMGRKMFIDRRDIDAFIEKNKRWDGRLA